jgi:hypothetical protein
VPAAHCISLIWPVAEITATVLVEKPQRGAIVLMTPSWLMVMQQNVGNRHGNEGGHGSPKAFNA